MRWLPFGKKNRVSMPPSQPPVDMQPARFKEAQDDYVAKHDKLVKPQQQNMVEAVKQSADFGKAIVNFMVFGNAGGLTALVVLAPIMQETNKLWLAQQFGTAFALGVGAALGVGIAVAAHFNYAGYAATFRARAERDEARLKVVEFGLGHEWHGATDAWLREQENIAIRRTNISNVVSVLIFIASAGCWVYGAVNLAMSASGS